MTGALLGERISLDGTRSSGIMIMVWENPLVVSRERIHGADFQKSYSWNSPQCGPLSLSFDVPISTYNYFRERRRLVAGNGTDVPTPLWPPIP